MSVEAVRIGLQWSDTVIPVGRLARLDRQIYFEYDVDFLKTHWSISPFHLPLVPGLKACDGTLFEGLPGVFNDSLPDGWGRLLLDRSMKSRGVLPGELTVLDRLAHVGRSGMGALVYEPDMHEQCVVTQSLDELALESQHILTGAADEVLTALLMLNGSSAGARPKVMVSVNAEKNNIVCGTDVTLQQWLIKFANSQESSDAGAIEYIYSLMAKKSGVIMTETHLFPAKNATGYFGTKRFDRDYKKRFHMHTVSGLLHSDFRVASLDYLDLLQLTESLTRDHRDVEQLFRQAVFNVLSHNRDDHLKNFSFIMNAQGEWHLSPAYDL